MSATPTPPEPDVIIQDTRDPPRNPWPRALVICTSLLCLTTCMTVAQFTPSAKQKAETTRCAPAQAPKPSRRPAAQKPRDEDHRLPAGSRSLAKQVLRATHAAGN